MKQKNPIFFFLLFITSYVNAQEIIIAPYLQNAFPDTMTIMWESDDSGSGEIQYGLDSLTLNQTVLSTTQLGEGQSQIHTAILEDLDASTPYYYKVNMEGGQESLIYSFVTPDESVRESSTQLVAISDMQRDGSHPDKFKEIIEEGIIAVMTDEGANEITDLEAVLIPGDLVANGGNYFEWKDYFFNPSKKLFSRVPLYPVPGNHEYYGGGLSNFIKYFTLPDNSPAGLEDQCWHKDISNIRIIGLNSNSDAADQNEQLNWLNEVLTSTCDNDAIDFVFAQLHHPYKSELWTPGENDFTGQVIDSLQTFSTECKKPSIHFFGHTHGYSRGQSRDHKHLWINVATAGGAIDNWGEFPNADYPEFVKSQDEYGFVVLDVVAGQEPKFTLKRYSRGDQDVTEDNVLRDELTIYKHEYIPYTPENIYPIDGDTVSILCLTLKASQFEGVQDTMQASHWQIAKGGNFIDSLVAESWYQNENFYNEINEQANDDLTDATFISLDANETYYWRTRYRDQNLEWSLWSDSTFFYLENSDTITTNLVLNHGAENGINEWVGDIESLENGECNSVLPYLGSHNFAVGGVCENEMDNGLAYQSIDLSGYTENISNGDVSAYFGAYIRDYNGVDLPEMYIELFDENDVLLSISETISSTTDTWTKVSRLMAVPINTTKGKINLKGTRNSGTDNDCYFDEIFLYLVEATCLDCFGTSGIDQDGDGMCSDLDCDDTNDLIYPGALELCDGIDNNCDGVWDQNINVTWTGNAGDNQWGTADNWDQQMVPLACQFVIIANNDSVIIDGVFACKGIDAGSNCSVTILEGSYLNIDSKDDNSITPACINGLLLVDGKWEVR